MEPVSRADPDSREARQDLASVHFRLGAVEISDRETVALYANIHEQIAMGLKAKDPAAAARAQAIAVDSVKNGSLVPRWRRG